MSLLDKPTITHPFDKYSFMKRSLTKVYPVAEIIKTEKGKKGLEDMQKKQVELEAICFEKKKTSGGNSKGNSQTNTKLTVKKTLVLDSKTKESKITSTIKKVVTKKSAPKVLKKSSTQKKNSISNTVLQKLKKNLI